MADRKGLFERSNVLVGAEAEEISIKMLNGMKKPHPVPQNSERSGARSADEMAATIDI